MHTHIHTIIGKFAYMLLINLLQSIDHAFTPHDERVTSSQEYKFSPILGEAQRGGERGGKEEKELSCCLSIIFAALDDRVDRNSCILDRVLAEIKSCHFSCQGSSP